MNKNKKVILMILDGWGCGDSSKSDAISQANTHYIKSLYEQYPYSQLLACGENVGLPDGQMGNSEVGHLNIGAGRIIYQDLVKINLSIRDGSINQNKEIIDAYDYALKNKKKLHLIGLVSDGGVHSSDKHLYSLCDMAYNLGLKDVFIHALMDGRDTDPHSGLEFLNKLNNHLKTSVGKIASVCGRYYTMDRDKRWERIGIGYELLVHGIGYHTNDVIQAMQESYDNNITDEFIRPIVCVDDSGKPLALIESGDVVFCFNFRTDRLREITVALTQKDMPEFNMKTLDLYYLTLTRYDESFQNIHVAFDKDNVTNILGEVVSREGLKQLRIAETEKYAHVTYFFSGGREKIFIGEERIMISSPKVATYDLQPEMSAYLVKDAVVAELKNNKFDFICLNFANGDMVGHTGIYSAIIKAIETVDKCVGEVVETALANDYAIIIIADHGNADHAMNKDGSPNTAHSLNPVPCIIAGTEYKSINNGILADVAPTILQIMNLPQPEEMTGKSLINF